MIAGEAGKLVAKFIDSDWPTHRSNIFDLLTLAMNRAWSEGKWLGMTKEMFVEIQADCDGQCFINAPQGYSTLLAINLDCKPRTFRDSHFMFHKNGFGDIKDHKRSCNWNQDVYDNGYFATEIDFKKSFPDGAFIGARSLSEVGENEQVFIAGDHEGLPAITYAQAGSSVFDGCDCVSVDYPDKARTVVGVEIPLGKEYVYIDNLLFDSIDSIAKTVTNGVIEVVAADPNTGKSEAIAYLMPWERKANYHRYLLPDTNSNTVHCLFKVSEQPEIVSDSQPLILDQKEAIISLTMGMHFIYNKTDVEKGGAFVLQGINSLEKQKRESESDDVFPLQVIGLGVDDVPKILHYY